MTRLILHRLAVSILLGAVTTVSVAWWFAVRPRPYANMPSHLALGSSHRGPSAVCVLDGVRFNLERCVGEAEIRASRPTGSGCSWLLPERLSREMFVGRIQAFSYFAHDPLRPFMDGPKDIVFVEYAVGWPCLALRCQQQWDDQELMGLLGTGSPVDDVTGALDTALREASEVNGAIPVPRFARDRGYRAFLPCHVLPAGFAANTATFGGGWLLVVAGPTVLRLMWRRRRGVCDQCAYPIGRSPVCTECGHRLDSSSS